MHNLEVPDIHNFNAAIGWLELGNPGEALIELEKISAECRGNPEVLEVEWRIFATKKDWPGALRVGERMVETAPSNPVSWINRSYSLHELKRTQEAWDTLLPAATQFPQVSVVPYNLACYACQLGQLDVARQCLAVAIQLKSKDEIKAMAQSDSDLQPLWDYIAAL